jgi:plastocyanin
MRDRTRDRAILPIVLPIGLLALLAGVLVGFSRILLSLGHISATATALTVAVAILLVAGVTAARPVVRASSLAAMAGAVAGIAMLAGGVALIAVTPSSETGGAPHGAAPAVTISASNIQFDTSKIELPAGQQATIRFENKDAGVQHNIAIYEDDTMQKLLFKGDLVTGPDTVDYSVPGLPPGTYYFHCDVHPTMNGSVVVTEGGGQAGGGAAPGGAGGGETGGGAAGGATVEPGTITASGIAFDTSTLTIPAGKPSALQFKNEDAGTPHNVAIYPSSSDLSNPLFRGDIVTGPATTTYDIPPLDSGSYYFHCDVHPTMSGSVTVK